MYGYARVSTVAQDLTNQLAQLKAVDCEKVYCEKLTGATADRPELKNLMTALSEGDVVIMPAVDRLSRDTTDLHIIAREMQKAVAGIRSLAEPFLDTTSDSAEIVERTARGRADAKAQNMKLGRKPKLTLHQEREAAQRLAAGETQRSVARSYNVSQSTISRQVLPEAGGI